MTICRLCSFHSNPTCAYLWEAAHRVHKVFKEQKTRLLRVCYICGILCVIFSSQNKYTLKPETLSRAFLFVCHIYSHCVVTISIDGWHSRISFDNNFSIIYTNAYILYSINYWYNCTFYTNSEGA